MTAYITKALFLNATECPLRAWFMFRNEGAATPTLAEQFRMEQGLDVHRRARSRYPDGMSAARAGIEEAAARTQELMADEAEGRFRRNEVKGHKVEGRESDL